jgi:hypothetical protein
MEEGFCLDGVKFSGKSDCKILDNEKEHELTSKMDRVLNSIRKKTVTEIQENEDNEFMNLVKNSSPGKGSPTKVNSKGSPDKFSDGYVGFSSTSSMLNKKNLRLDQACLPEGLGESSFDDFTRGKGSDIVLLLDEENTFKTGDNTDFGLGKRRQPCASDLMDEGFENRMHGKKYLITVPMFKL